MAPWREWLRLAWLDPQIAEAAETASPVLSQRVEAVLGGAPVSGRQVRRMAMSLARYMVRAGSRATPYGLFAGVTPARLGGTPAVRFGCAHRAQVRPDARWLDAIITELESDPAVLACLKVVASTLITACGDRLRITGPSGQDGTAEISEISVRLTPAVALALNAAGSPISCAALAEKLAAEFPSAPQAKITGVIADLVRHRMLISELRAPSTVDDPLGYLLGRLDGEKLSRPVDQDLLGRLGNLLLGSGL